MVKGGCRCVLPWSSRRSDICSAAPNPAYVDPGCNGCGTASGYPGYDGAVMGSEIYSDGGYYGGEIIQQGGGQHPRPASRGSNTLPPPMGSLQLVALGRPARGPVGLMQPTAAWLLRDWRNHQDNLLLAAAILGSCRRQRRHPPPLLPTTRGTRRRWPISSRPRPPDCLDFSWPQFSPAFERARAVRRRLLKRQPLAAIRGRN